MGKKKTSDCKDCTSRYGPPPSQKVEMFFMTANTKPKKTAKQVYPDQFDVLSRRMTLKKK